MAGLTAARNRVARICGKIETKSTHCKAASTSARSRSVVIGRPLPFNSRTERSPFKPTTRKSPSARAACKYRTCPTCSRSKQPFVATSFFPAARNFSQRSESSSRSTIFGLIFSWSKLLVHYGIARQFRSWRVTDLRDVVKNGGKKNKRSEERRVGK